MKAIRLHHFGGPEVLKLEEIPDLRPGPDEVSLRAEAIGVNPVDVYICSGRYGEKAFPFTPGFDAAGMVLEVGANVTKWKAGDRVYTQGTVSGAYAERVVCRFDQVYPLPAKVSFKEGAALGVPYATAYYALFNRGLAKPGESVLVHGASGGVGVAAVQIARSRGLLVIGTGGTSEGRELIAKQGAQHVLNHRAAGYLAELMKITDGKGVDLILEMLANVNLAKDLQVLAVDGRVIVIGSRGTVEIDPRALMMRNSDIRGMALLNVGPDVLGPIHAALGVGLEDGSLRPVVGKEFGLVEAAKAHEHLERHQHQVR